MFLWGNPLNLEKDLERLIRESIRTVLFSQHRGQTAAANWEHSLRERNGYNNESKIAKRDGRWPAEHAEHD